MMVTTSTRAWFFSRSGKSVPSTTEKDIMRQQLILKVNFSPVQIHSPALLPEKFLPGIPFEQWKSQTVNFFYSNRYMVGISIILGCYIIACNYAVQANKLLEQTDTWTSWHSEMSAEQLMTIPDKELAKELVLEIQRRYSNPQNPTDFISPLIAFVRAIDREIETLKKYLTYYTWVHKLHAQRILPIQQKAVHKANDGYKKIVYVKTVFLTWAADYKINHNKAKVRYDILTSRR
jgi:hypothetical protein